MYRCDRNVHTRGGGVLIAVKKCISSNLETSITRNDVETLFIILRIRGGKCILNCTYIPPGSSIDKYESFIQSVEEVGSNNSDSEIILIGDFNQPQIK